MENVSQKLCLENTVWEALQLVKENAGGEIKPTTPTALQKCPTDSLVSQCGVSNFYFYHTLFLSISIYFYFYLFLSLLITKIPKVRSLTFNSLPCFYVSQDQ